MTRTRYSSPGGNPYYHQRPKNLPVSGGCSLMFLALGLLFVAPVVLVCSQVAWYVAQLIGGGS
jgi:hypothetical protein